MQGYIYPAIFYKDNDDGVYRVYFPDIELATEGKVMEEAFLWAKEFLKAYFVQVQKYGFEYNEPSEYEVVRAKTANDSTVMLIVAVVTKKDLKK